MHKRIFLLTIFFLTSINLQATYWNREGRKYGPLSPEVREWMTTADNYYLEYYGHNRSDGGKMTERYLPPVDNE